MCTLTYLPLENNNFILTSSRDESPMRKTKLPKSYVENGVELTYPKDELAGGTWIGASEKNRLVCLLNGGFKNHVRNTYYKLSRGIIVKNILSSENVIEYINDFNFDEIEPFTLVLLDYSNELYAYELVWAGEQKYFTILNKEPKIWSSSSLYTEEMKQCRKNWFSDWLLKNNDFSQEEILKFHKNETLGDADVSIKMKRSYVETVSITSIKKENSKIDILYTNVLEGETNTLQMKLEEQKLHQ